MRTFDTGATRDDEDTKLDFEGFLAPECVVRFAKYMDKHRIQPNGNVRDSDNWQKGMPIDTYMKSGWRHFMDWWLEHRGHESREGLENALCGVIFNAFGYLYEVLND